MELWQVWTIAATSAIVFLILGLRVGAKAYWQMQTRLEIERRRDELRKHLFKAREEYIAAKSTFEACTATIWSQEHTEKLHEWTEKRDAYNAAVELHNQILWILNADEQIPPIS